MKNLFIVLCAAVMLTSCTGTGVIVSSNSTQVQLNSPNYKIIATSVSGEAKAGYLFGASIGLGMYTQTFALIPLKKDRSLYKLAMEDLWKNFEARFGKAQDRRLALINVRYDSEALNTFFYTQPKITVIADVIEFQ